MKKGILLFIAVIAAGCASQRSQAKYDELAGERAQFIDAMHECAAEPGCYQSDRYQYLSEQEAHLSVAMGDADPNLDAWSHPATPLMVQAETFKALNP